MEQRSFTDGRIVVFGDRPTRRKRKRADYLLRHTRDFTIAVVEAKANYKTPGDGLQQAKDYAEILGLKFAYATNGDGIIEFDYTTGRERELDAFPSPDVLWSRYCKAKNIMGEQLEKRLLTPYYHAPGKAARYYQEIAINRSIEAILLGKKRILLTMATGTGKTLCAFQICWKLWESGWNARGEKRRPRILYLADRNILIDDPKDKTFTPFGDARWKIENGEAIKSREMYFATYQSLAKDERRPGLFKEYAPEFFDLIVVDECHRGSARDESNWREILEYFAPAYQLGMTATPLRDDNRNTYEYFGDPIYTYSLRQGIEDGFLAPYRVHRIVTDVDATGYRPTHGEKDRYGNVIPDGEYQTKDFERVIALRARTEAITRHLAEFMKNTDRFAKTIVFCVDQEHADEMRRALNNLNSDLVVQHPDYVCRVTADEGDIGIGHLSKFQELETITPVILTTSKLLSTGVDAPTCKNIVLARVIGSMTEFKQIIGRGTRVRDDYGKFFFSILDYTGSATTMFADPAFDGYPLDGGSGGGGGGPGGTGGGGGGGGEDGNDAPRKYYVDGGHFEIATHYVSELDPDGKQLRVIKFTDYAAEKVRVLYPTASSLQAKWADLEQRAEIIAALEERGIDFESLSRQAGQPEADPFDLLCHLAFNAPLQTRKQRAEQLKRRKADFFGQYGPEARGILEELLEKYSEHGTTQFELPEVLKVPPISEHGNVSEIISIFGGAERLKDAVDQLQMLLYAA
jgi:type I restriction enzyme R subunit